MMESGLAFLGVGITVPTASWGSMVNEARPYLLMHPLYVLAPCVFIVLLIICLNLLGDGIRDAMDPSLRGEV
jgi:peptide/nickel transport system permease protein